MRLFQKCQDLFSFSVHSLQDLDCLDQPSFVPPKPQQQTGVDELELNAPSPPTRSVKKLTPFCEISFEKDMLKEHRLVFANEYRNYIEFEQGQNKGEEGFNNGGASPEELEERMFLGVEGVLEGRMEGLDPEQKRQFAKDLEHQSNFKAFLDFVCSSCPSQTAEQLVLLAMQVWNTYVPYQTSHLDITDLIQLAQQTASNPSSLLPISQLSSHPNPPAKMHKFMEIYCTTVILVVTEYFQNPYLVEQKGSRSMKRPLALTFSDSDESQQSFSPLLVKKRKMSDLSLNK